MSETDVPEQIEVHPFFAAFKAAGNRIGVHPFADTGSDETDQVGSLLAGLARPYPLLLTPRGAPPRTDEALQVIRRLSGTESDAPTDPGESRVAS
jgi:hypothetical protein